MGFLGEFLALIESLRHFSEVNGNNKAKVMSDALRVRQKNYLQQENHLKEK